MKNKLATLQFKLDDLKEYYKRKLKELTQSFNEACKQRDRNCDKVIRLNKEVEELKEKVKIATRLIQQSNLNVPTRILMIRELRRKR